MGDMIESGYIKGKFERTLPFLMLGEPTNGLRYNEQKRNLKTRGAFNIIFNKHTNPSYIRGYILPIALCSDEEMKDFFLKLQRVIKKNKNRRDFNTIINSHLEESGFGYLKLSLYSYKNGYIAFKIVKEIYSKLLTRGFHYVTKMLDTQGRAIEILDKREFRYDKYTKFLEAIYGEENLLKREIVPFRLVYVFENTTVGQYFKYENFWDKSYSIPAQKLQNYFDIKKSCKVKNIHNIEMDDRGYGWIDITIETFSSKLILKCSDVFDPFLNLYNWLHLIKSDDRNHSIIIDEEGIDKTVEAYPFEDKLYLVIRNNGYDKEVYFEGVVDRDYFANHFLNRLEDFLLNKFNSNKKEQFWRGEEIYKVIDLLKYPKVRNIN